MFLFERRIHVLYKMTLGREDLGEIYDIFGKYVYHFLAAAFTLC